jgi:lipoprotein-anchoring transpeptidase ErfK/SrfK
VAVFWLQAREGLPATGVVDSLTYERLFALAGRPSEVVRTHELTADDVRGPFVRIPGNIYEHARLDCSCYESLGEKLTESFHARGELLRRLNPGVDLDRVAAGTRLRVPATRPMDTPPVGQIAELWVSGEQNFLQAVDASGRILYHFPTTLGSSYDPSPQGDFSVRSIHPDPWWHYQPKILAHVPDDRPEASIPPGPNNSVGRVWIALSVPHYGIHGTKSPETIGYAQSAGCVRLTNWDVLYLSRRVPAGTPVRFRDTRRGDRQPAPAAAPAQVRAPAPSGPRVLGVRADSAAAPRTERSNPPEPPRPQAAPAPAADTTRPTTPG